MPICLFCSETKLTQEHLWPVWVCQLFPNTSYDAGRFSETAGKERFWKQNTLERTTRAVCAVCNNGWMSEVECRGKPVLRPLIMGEQPPKLTDNNQRRLATWALLRFYAF